MTERPEDLDPADAEIARLRKEAADVAALFEGHTPRPRPSVETTRATRPSGDSPWWAEVLRLALILVLAALLLGACVSAPYVLNELIGGGGQSTCDGSPCAPEPPDPADLYGD